MQQLIEKLPEDRKNCPKTFFKIVKAVGRLNSQTSLVKGFTNKDGTAAE